MTTPPAVKLAVDVHYDESNQLGRAAAVVFRNWDDPAPFSTGLLEGKRLEPYQSGQFFRRELPFLEPLIRAQQRKYSLETILVDGYVDLAPGEAGLGRRLYYCLNGTAEVIGVAKRPFSCAPSVAIHRGKSKRALWISSTDNSHRAACWIQTMHGHYRIPTLLRQVDQLSRATTNGADPV